MGCSSGHLTRRYCTFGFDKIRGIYWQPERVPASQEGNCSTELILLTVFILLMKTETSTE